MELSLRAVVFFAGFLASMFIPAIARRVFHFDMGHDTAWMNVVIGLFLLVWATTRILHKQKPGPSGKGLLVLGVTGYGAVIIWFALAAVISWALSLAIWESLVVVFATLATLSCLDFLVRWLYDRRSGGAIVLDCGPLPNKGFVLLLAAWMLFMGVSSTVSSEWFKQFGVGAVPRVILIPFSILLALACFIQGVERLQVRERGLWLNGGLMRWNKIESFRWEKNSMLWVTKKGRLALFNWASARIPPEHQQTVDELLRTNCSLEPSV